jgi:ribosomal protein S18 acetylase RimI-like enzyme
MEKKIRRYFLELKDMDLKKLNIKILEPFKIFLDNKKDFKINKFFYKQVGREHYWRDRLLWSDSEWLKYASNANLETWILSKGDDLVGFYEQEYHHEINEVELINMGVLKEHRGNKLGSALLNHSITSAFKKKPKRIWVHTCSLDHKHALQNYRSKGFKVFKEEEIDFVA